MIGPSRRGTTTGTSRCDRAINTHGTSGKNPTQATGRTRESRVRCTLRRPYKVTTATNRTGESRTGCGRTSIRKSLDGSGVNSTGAGASTRFVRQGHSCVKGTRLGSGGPVIRTCTRSSTVCSTTAFVSAATRLGITCTSSPGINRGGTAVGTRTGSIGCSGLSTCSLCGFGTTIRTRDHRRWTIIEIPGRGNHLWTSRRSYGQCTISHDCSRGGVNWRSSISSALILVVLGLGVGAGETAGSGLPRGGVYLVEPEPPGAQASAASAAVDGRHHLDGR